MGTFGNNGTMTKHIRVEAPAGMDALEIAQLVVGEHVLLKAEHLKYHERTFQHHPAMEELSANLVEIYRAQMARMIDEILTYVEKEVVLGSVRKAEGDAPPPSLLTPEQLEHIQQIIRDYHAGLIVGVVDPSALPPEEIQRLIDAGVIPQDLAYVFQPKDPSMKPPERIQAIDTAYQYGRSLIPVRQYHTQRGPDPRQIDLPDFMQRIPKEPPLSRDEKHSVQWARHSAAVHIRGLGNRIADDFATVLIEEDKAQRTRYEQIVREKLEENIEKRETWRKLASELGHATGDWSRDFGRIAATEKQNAVQEGIAAGLKKRVGEPKNVWVAKIPNPDACPDCVRLHLTAGPGSKPRIFKLSELQANGSNVGRKRGQWRPVVGVIHPWCACSLIHVPDGWAFNDENDLVPESLLRSETLERDLIKAQDMTYGDSVPEHGVAVRVGDPTMRAEIDKVIAMTPPEVFDKRVGVTLITTDIPRSQNPLEDHDFAYWTANEIRLMQTLDPKRIARVLPHEISHSLNVYLMHKLGSVKAVRAWHDQLWAISKEEGFVSDYAKREPIENAAEVTMNLLYKKPRLMLLFPRQFRFVHESYRDIFRKPKRADLLDQRPEQSA